MKCTDCGTELNSEEAADPRMNKNGDIICDACFEKQYSHICSLCEEYFDEDFSETISPKYILITEYAAKELGSNPGIYEILSYPFFAEDMKVEIRFFKTAIKKIADLPSGFDDGDWYMDLCYVCEDCVKKMAERIEAEEAK